MLELGLTYANIALEIISIVFITFVFFDLVFIDRNIKLTEIAEKFEKFKRYDIFKSSLIFLVLALYFFFFAKLSVYFDFPVIALSLFSLIGNLFLLMFVYKLYQLLHKYVPQ
jgi:Na+/H+ antiporter NhaD/arsenite permease-like protein